MSGTVKQPSLYFSDDEIAKFWSQVDKRSDSECWLWLGYRTSSVGMFRFGRKHISVRKMAYELTYGPVSNKIRTKCNEQFCCNPNHLRVAGDLEPLFWSRVDRKTDSECWLWTGCVSEGRGLLQYNNKKHQTNRLAYTLLIGPVKETDEVRCTCKNKLCCNPNHLRLVDKSIPAKSLSEAARKLAEDCYNLAWKKALQESAASGIHPDDLLSEAMWILCRMASWYDPQKGKPFPPIVGKYITKRLRTFASKQRQREMPFTDYFGDSWTSNDIEDIGEQRNAAS